MRENGIVYPETTLAEAGRAGCGVR
jgi:hypothetical protein